MGVEEDFRYTRTTSVRSFKGGQRDFDNKKSLVINPVYTIKIVPLHPFPRIKQITSLSQFNYPNLPNDSRFGSIFARSWTSLRWTIPLRINGRAFRAEQTESVVQKFMESLPHASHTHVGLRKDLIFVTRWRRRQICKRTKVWKVANLLKLT